MKPLIHAATSLTLGAILWFFTRSFYAGLLCFASGVFIDLDHAIEFMIHHDWRNFTIRNMFTACEHTEKQEGYLKFNKVYLIFHSVELLLLLWIFAIITKNIYLMAVALGCSVHLAMDYMSNARHFYSYFITARIVKKFSTEKLFRKY